MKAKIKKGLTFFKPDGSKITVSTVDIKNQLVYYTQAEADGSSTDHLMSLPKKQFEAILSVGSESNSMLVKKVIPAASVGDASSINALQAKIDAAYAPNPAKAQARPNESEPDSLNHLPNISDYALTLDLGKDKFKMQDGSQWRITSTVSEVVAVNSETESSQTFAIDHFRQLVQDGHVVLF